MRVIGGGDAHAALRQVTVGSPVDVCSFVEELGPDAVGELVLDADGASRGAVFVEQGRVCWAAARGLARRFTELLVAHTGAPARAVEEVVVGCLADGSPFGERLVATSLVSPSQLRATLLQHAAESLHVACREPAFGTWCPRRHRGYASRFTFTAAEMLARTLAEENGEAAVAGRLLLEAVLDTGDGGAVFVRRADRSTPQPVVLSGAFRADARGLIRAGKWAASALDVAAACGSEPRQAAGGLRHSLGPAPARHASEVGPHSSESHGSFIAASHDGATLVAWTMGSLLAVATTTPLGASRLLRHARGQMGMDLHGHI